MSSDSYLIADEPSPGALAKLTVNPLWPFVAVMFGGAWVSWGWFLFNGIAVGSPTLRREAGWIVAGLVIGIVLIYGISFLSGIGIIPDQYLKYVLLLVISWKLAVSYVLYNLQSHSIELYEYYGGKLKNGVIVVIMAYLVSPALIHGLPFSLRLLLG